jgi:hypothetical protein
MNAKEYLAQAIDPVTGAIRPLSQLLEAEHSAKFSARQAEILATQATEAAKSQTQKLVERFQAEHDHARRNDDHARAKFWKPQLDKVKDQLASERAVEAKAKAFAGDRRIALIRTEADLIQRSGVHLLPNASQIERDNLVAIARSNDYPTPEAQYRDFKELSDRLTDVELEAERVKQSDAQIEAARQELAAATSRVQQSELELLRVKRENVADVS